MAAYFPKGSKARISYLFLECCEELLYGPQYLRSLRHMLPTCETTVRHFIDLVGFLR